MKEQGRRRLTTDVWLVLYCECTEGFVQTELLYVNVKVYQIVHVVTCAMSAVTVRHSCPYASAPYKDKLTLFTQSKRVYLTQRMTA